MINDENKDDLIERYLMGKLSLWELAEIEGKIKSDYTFAEEVSFERDLLVGIRESRRLELYDMLAQMKRKPWIFRIPRLTFDKPTLLRYGIAACIVLFVTGTIFYQDISNAMTPNSKRGHYSLVSIE